MTYKILFCIFYLVCSFCAWGIMTGYVQCYYGDTNSVCPAAIVAVLGPAGLGVAALMQATDNGATGKGFHFALRPFDREQRWHIFHAKYSMLSRYYFDHGHEEADKCDCER